MLHVFFRQNSRILTSKLITEKAANWLTRFAVAAPPHLQINNDM
jgi:hypothetical protein